MKKGHIQLMQDHVDRNIITNLRDLVISVVIFTFILSDIYPINIKWHVIISTLTVLVSTIIMMIYLSIQRNKKKTIDLLEYMKNHDKKLSINNKKIMIRFLSSPNPANTDSDDSTDVNKTTKDFINDSNFWDWSFYKKSDSHEINNAMYEEIKKYYIGPNSTTHLEVIDNPNVYTKSRIYIGYINSNPTSVFSFNSDIKVLIDEDKVFFETMFEYELSNNSKNHIITEYTNEKQIFEHFRNDCLAIKLFENNNRFCGVKNISITRYEKLNNKKCVNNINETDLKPIKEGLGL